MIDKQVISMLILREVTALSFDAVEQLSMLRLWFSSDRLPNPYLTVDTAFLTTSLTTSPSPAQPHAAV